MIEDILSQVHKPGRYIGREWNVCVKDFDKTQVKFALCFPDLYEIGMSNLGIRIIYAILNSLSDVTCERFFACASDMENILRSNSLEIFSLESRRGLKEFDLVGFSLGYELSYTNVLNMLELGAIPLEAAMRGPEYPLVIGGGPCVLNPEPLHEFFDLFVIGEAEEVILEIIAAYRELKHKFKSLQIDKQDLLIELSQIEGVYVPSLYSLTYNGKGKIEEFRPRFSGVAAKIKKRFISDLDQAYFPTDWLLPYIQVVHDRISFEVMRGCPNQCRFCQARTQYFPLRLRSANNVADLIQKAYQKSGYEEVALCGLSVSDYPGIEELVGYLIKVFKDRGVSVSLPSIRSRANVGNLFSLIATIRKSGLTFAPEAASERLRRILNKDFNPEDFFKAVEEAYLSGYQNVKLYFMTGIPFEEESDLDAIVDFANHVSALGRKVDSRPAGVNISINTLIPKPHTSLQWFAMENIERINYKYNHIKKKIKNRKLKLAFHDPQMSILEAVFSRGDRKLSQVIFSAFKKGARFDAWGDYFSYGRWEEAFAECGIDVDFYLQPKERNEFLPWDFIDTGISKDLFLKEYDKLIEKK